MTRPEVQDEPPPDDTTMRALTIGLGDEVFAIEATSVREILDMVPVTEVPNAPAFVGGLINVRGRVVPLADLRVKFGMDRPSHGADTRVVVIEVELEEEPAIVGMLADRVHKVTDLELSALEEAPRVGMQWRPEYIRGIARSEGHFIIVPELSQIFAAEKGRSGSLETEGKV